MNLSTKLTISRIGIACVILFFLLFPWTDVGFTFPLFLFNGKILIDTKYIIVGVLFFLACVTDFLDGYLARKEKKTSDFGSMLDQMANKILIDGILITLAYQGFLSLLVPTLVIVRDLFVDGLRMLSYKNNQVLEVSKLSKIKTICMFVGILLLFFYNLPFEIWGIYVAEILVDIATILSVISAIFYFIEWKEKMKVEELNI